MRDLTPEELALAPKWATHYSFTSFDVLCFVDLKNKIVTSVEGIKKGECPISCGNCFEGVALPEIPRNQFDITQHEWSCFDVVGAKMDGENALSIELNSRELGFVELNKPDGIAIAKALGVTAEDLK